MMDECVRQQVQQMKLKVASLQFEYDVRVTDSSRNVLCSCHNCRSFGWSSARNPKEESFD